MQQGHRVQSAGDGDQNGLTPTQEPLRADGLFNGGDQVAHSLMLLAPGREASGFVRVGIQRAQLGSTTKLM